MLTTEKIQRGKSEAAIRGGGHHEHDDCIRIAYEWLDAQKKTQSTRPHSFPLKHIIERWAGRYVSQSDVEVAAYLHPEIKGSYPEYNISSRLTEPSKGRLIEIPEAFTQGQDARHNPKSYTYRE